jgi:hypothetical protein
LLTDRRCRASYTTRILLDIEPALNVSICLKLSTPSWRQDAAHHAGTECPAGRMRMQMSRHAWSHVPTDSSSRTSITREHFWQVSCAYIASVQNIICVDVHCNQCGARVPIMVHGCCSVASLRRDLGQAVQQQVRLTHKFCSLCHQLQLSIADFDPCS